MTPRKVETIVSMTLATTLIDGDGLVNNSVQTLLQTSGLFPGKL